MINDEQVEKEYAELYPRIGLTVFSPLAGEHSSPPPLGEGWERSLEQVESSPESTPVVLSLTGAAR